MSTIVLVTVLLILDDVFLGQLREMIVACICSGGVVIEHNGQWKAICLLILLPLLVVLVEDK